MDAHTEFLRLFVGYKKPLQARGCSYRILRGRFLDTKKPCGNVDAHTYVLRLFQGCKKAPAGTGLEIQNLEGPECSRSGC